MLFFLLSFFSFVLILSKSFLKLLQATNLESRIQQTFALIFGEELKTLFVPFYSKRSDFFTKSFQFPVIENFDEKDVMISLLDLPDLVLDSVLEKLTPSCLYIMAGVCNSLREKCSSDYLWEKHMKQKWGEIIGDAAKKEWECYIASKRVPKFLNCRDQKGIFRIFSEFLLYKSDVEERKNDLKSSLSLNSVMSCYLALENGKFWFPAQVINREVQNGHVGFTLSSYDAKLSYDSRTDTFIARYPIQGQSTIEDNIEWNRIRASSVDTLANCLHISDCLNELKPDDHIEIQWRRNKDFPYGWWYGVVGHLESCSGNEFNCNCHIYDTVMLEFQQYTIVSRWRKIMISRRDYIETGNEADGFYGGIKKLHNKEEIAKWKIFWPNCTAE